VPDSIRVNIAELQLGQAIHVKDLQMPEGVKVFNEPDAIVVHVTAPLAEEEAAPAEAAPGAAESGRACPTDAADAADETYRGAPRRRTS